MVNLSERLQKLMEINRSQPIQRTPAWFDARKNCITASSAGSLLVKSEEVCREYIKNFPRILEKYPDFINDTEYANPYQTKNDYILSKCGKGKPFQGNIATEWGCRYEDIVCKFYENTMKTKVEEFGLMPHNEHEWVKASPDGISHNDVMLEIKVPYRRKLDGIIPFYYWIQVQLQLEVCDLDECDYLECKINQVDVHAFEEEMEFPKGFFYEEQGGVFHSYKGDYQKYIDDGKNVKFFIIREYEIMNIKREREWFERVKPGLLNSWNEILYHRETDCKFLNGTMYIDDDCGEMVVMKNSAERRDVKNYSIASETEDEMEVSGVPKRKKVRKNNIYNMISDSEDEE